MRRSIYLLLIALLLGMAVTESRAVHAATPTPSAWIALTAPEDGQAVQGVVAVVGEAKGGGMQFVELSFAYSSDKTGTWFPLATINPEKGDEFQVEWDTTTITDGEYDLRLTVTYTHDTLTKLVSGVRVRNYTPIETKTPSPTETPHPTQEDSSLVETTVFPSTPTPLPPNPADVGKGDVFNALGVGLAIIGGLFALLGIYTGLRKTFR